MHEYFSQIWDSISIKDKIESTLIPLVFGILLCLADFFEPWGIRGSIELIMYIIPTFGFLLIAFLRIITSPVIRMPNRERLLIETAKGFIACFVILIVILIYASIFK